MSRRYDPQFIETPGPLDTPCWVWQWCKSPKGYGFMRDRDAGRTRLAHIVYYEREHGPVSDGLELDHRCQRRDCVNPDHLEPVTHETNLQRGRMAKLTPADVLAIRAEFAAGDVRKIDLARRYGVTGVCISNVVRRKTWRTLEAPSSPGDDLERGVDSLFYALKKRRETNEAVLARLTRGTHV